MMASTAALAADTQAWPTKPLRMLTAELGGGSDLSARLIAQGLSGNLGQQVVVDNRVGGVIIADVAAKSAPDGYTLFTYSSTLWLIPFMRKQTPYDPVKDFAPVSLMIRNSSMLLVSPSAPFNTFPEYLAYARANPGKINFGTTGSGGIYHIVGAWLHSLSKTEVTFVHYKGSGPMYTDMIAGRVQAAPAITFIGMPLVKSGKLKAIANLGTDRAGAMPDLKTVAEQGVPGFEYPSWSGYLAPAKTPPAIVNRLSAEFAKVAKSPDLVKKFESEYTVLVGSTPEEFAKTISTEYVRWRKVVEENNIKLEE